MLLTVALSLVGAFIVAGTVIVQGVGWLAADVADALGSPVTGTTWAVVGWLTAALTAIPAGLIWLLARFVTPEPVRVRAAARLWTLAGIASGLVGLARVVPLPHNELLLLVTAAAATLCGFLLRLLPKRDAGPVAKPASTGRLGSFGFAVTAGLVSLLPWLWAGALGGLTETVCAAIAAAAVGWLASGLLDGPFFAAFARSRAALVGLGGLVAGVSLVCIGAGVGGRGINLAELVVLPALGFAIAGLVSRVTPQGRPRWPIAIVVGIAAFGPLALVDPEETSINLGFTDVGYWATIAGGVSVLIGLIVSAVYAALLRPDRSPARWLVAVVTAVAVLAAAGVYTITGRPGFYGERLFVVMADQADLSGLAAIPDRDARLRATYERLVSHARQSQAALLDTLRQWHLSYTPYYLVNGVMVDGGPVIRQWLSGRSDVDRVLLDPRLRPLPVGVGTELGDAAAPDGSPQWNIDLIQADRAWTQLGARGQGIVIGTSDSGVDGSHPALRGSFRGGDDSWLDPWNGTTTPTDHGGHGTHTMGTVLGRNGIGVAPDAQWIGCVNLDRNAASPSRYLDCLQFMLAPYPPGADPFTAGRPNRAADVLTNSWGCPGVEGCDLESLRPAIAALRAAGIFFVAAAGNTGPTCGSVKDPPAPYVDAFTVGAVDRERAVASFSSRGPTPDGRSKPDVVAPGVAVLSSMPRGTYGILDGTSMATPHVAGVVALMWSANPALIGDIDATEEILRETATTVTTPSTGSNGSTCAQGDVSGAGLVDAYAAVAAAKARA